MRHGIRAKERTEEREHAGDKGRYRPNVDERRLEKSHNWTATTRNWTTTTRSRTPDRSNRPRDQQFVSFATDASTLHAQKLRKQLKRRGDTRNLVRLLDQARFHEAAVTVGAAPILAEKMNNLL